jgi:hypothetical protein
VLFLLAAQSPNLVLPTVLTGVGFVIGVFGQVIKSRVLILTGIVMIGAAGAYIVSRGQFSGR